MGLFKKKNLHEIDWKGSTKDGGGKSEGLDTREVRHTLAGSGQLVSIKATADSGTLLQTCLFMSVR